MPGILYIVATPIGNLADMTYRAVEVLRSVDAVACEDTRQTRKLLDHYGIRVRLVSYHEHNEATRSAELVDLLKSGANVALVSDAGTPLVSDPGFRVVRAALDQGIKVIPIPGPAAVLAALSASGLPAGSFYFGGFLPRKKQERRALLSSLVSLETAMVFYEAPHRILESLEDIREFLSDPQLVLARELTKIHEEFLRGSASEVHAVLAARERILGEITLVIAPAEPRPVSAASPVELVLQYESQGLPRMEAIKAAAHDLGLPKRDLYRLVEADRKP